MKDRIIKFLGSLVRDDSTNSSMRFAFVLFSLSNIIVVLSIAMYIIIHAIRGTIVDWAGVAIGCAGSGAAITAFATQKVAQKKIEEQK